VPSEPTAAALFLAEARLRLKRSSRAAIKAIRARSPTPRPIPRPSLAPVLIPWCLTSAPVRPAIAVDVLVADVDAIDVEEEAAVEVGFVIR